MRDLNGIEIIEPVARINRLNKTVEIRRFETILSRKSMSRREILNLYTCYIQQADAIVTVMRDVIDETMYDGMETETASLLSRAALCFLQAKIVDNYLKRTASTI